MSTLLEAVHDLVGTIGPRRTGTPREAAADYVARRLMDIRLVPVKYSFRCIPSQNTFPIAICLLVLLAVMIYALSAPITRWLEVIFSLSATWLLWQTIRSAFNALIALLPKVTRPMLVDDDVRTLRGHSYHAIGIVRRDPQTVTLPIGADLTIPLLRSQMRSCKEP